MARKIKRIIKRKASAAKRRPQAKKAARKTIKTRSAAKGKIAAEVATVDGAPTGRRGAAPSTASSEEVKTAIGTLLGNETAIAFLRKNVSKWAPDVLNMLVTPKTDEYLAEQLGMKINAVRRILNLMQGYGVTNYYVAKNTNGWLSFAWYINVSKVSPFFDYINSVSSKRTVVTNECNDYFVCNECYPKDKLIFTFDAAFEAAFRCNCGGKFARITKDAAEKLSAEEMVAQVRQNSVRGPEV